MNSKKTVWPLSKTAGFLSLAIPLLVGAYHYLLLAADPSPYQPPAEGSLLSVSGQFMPQKWQLCYRGDACPPLQFRTQDRETIWLNCEPRPAINQCLFDKKGVGDNNAIADKPLTVKYYNAGTNAEPFYVFLSLAKDDGFVTTYSDRVSEIKNTAVARVDRRSPGLFRYTLPSKDIQLVWNMYWGIPWLVALTYFASSLFLSGRRRPHSR
jgi:hypothetical protein